MYTETVVHNEGKAREPTQHGSLAAWMEENDQTGRKLYNFTVLYFNI
jgi:hypothetical protein